MSIPLNTCQYILTIVAKYLLCLLSPFESQNYTAPLPYFHSAHYSGSYLIPHQHHSVFWDNFFLCCIILITVEIDPGLHSVLDWIHTVSFLGLYLMISCCHFKVKICMRLEMIYCAWFVLSAQFKVIYVASVWNTWLVFVCRGICSLSFFQTEWRDGERDERKLEWIHTRLSAKCSARVTKAMFYRCLHLPQLHAKKRLSLHKPQAVTVCS